MIKRLSLSDLIIKFTLILLIIWSPLQIWILKIDGAGRIPALFSFISLFIVILSSRRIFNRVSFLYLTLLIYILINGYIKGGYLYHYPKNPLWLMFWSLSKPFIAMLLMNYSLRVNFRQTINLITLSLVIYCFFCLLFSSSVESRVDLDINANEIALTSAIAYGFILLNATYQRYSKLKLLLLAIIPFSTTLMTASRMGFTMIAVVTFYAIIKRTTKPSAKTYFIMFCSLIACVTLFGYILNHTEVGTRFQSTMSTTEENESLQTGTILDNFGDRGFQYYSSWDLFCDNATTGIGFMSWPLYNPTNHVCHSEYLFQYLENGLIGFLLYLLFLGLLYGKLKQVKSYGNTKYILMAMFISVLFADFVLWTYSSVAVFALYSVILTYDNQ